MKDYMIEYEKFMADFRIAEVSGEEVGLAVARMATYYARYNTALSSYIREYAVVSKDLHGQTDSSGKAITTSKAEVLAEATPEAARYQEAKSDVQNIEQIINALKSLQKGVLLEYSHSV